MAVHVGNLRNDLLLGLYGCNAFHLGLQRCGPFFLDRALVHAGRIIVANFLLDDGALSGRLCLVEEVAQDVEIVFIQLVEATPSCLVRRNGIVLYPVSARILIEIDTGIDGLVDGRQVEVGDLLGKLRGRGGLGHCKYSSQQQWENGKRTDPHICLAYELALHGKPVSLRGALTKDRTECVLRRRRRSPQETLLQRLLDWEIRAGCAGIKWRLFKKASGEWSDTSWDPG